ncbi:peptidylprolyl isomerase [Phenylobacterium sp.]|jgi:parvulin-like peptidyl-prolyl isomerase|uniref:peptidylprolyl isomerase n=1 Tax=Phenylobacterium sp. TaxID=1871053 RepID=UPI002E36B085|nr:peptidylprolyl isomerase [Phenylobacterium sp.]HEX3366346.1 peptidylprolyl isomerase [Phenylobacterium sp.]
MTADPTISNIWDFSRVSVRRSLALMAAGAAVGLALAGYSLFTAQSTTTLFVPAEDVALVNQQPIARADYYAQLQASFRTDFAHTTPAQRRKVLEDMIREELFVQRGKELDVAAADPDVRSATVNAVEQMAAADAITAEPSDAKLRAYFHAHADKYEQEGVMTVRDMLFATAADGAAAARALRAGEPDAAVLARLRGRDSGKETGQDFYFAAKIHLGNELFDTAAALPSGGVSTPVPQADGVHVLHMLKNTAPQPIAFETARPQVLQDYRNERVRQATVQYQGFLRKRANLLVAKDLR